ncbi:ParA family protein [Gloeothece verrucosa]|uniref:Cobyrinic acid ac-diamide synthase n=1 Tax=Gloeothece verrucosa (strain PCC 7822) TaxID=497965 RepID=E0UN30_GLOV7|nr:ParA family protein [Gloeothece verrucosa]ADN18360.1 Cobyrinic acid ac-diamide synthase [Gloeothece verrucosa PCC 7822]
MGQPPGRFDLTMQQLRLAILSNAGGSGKTTLTTHLTYLLAKARYSVVTIDLDPQGSINLFCGLERPTSERTISKVLCDDKFNGRWPLVKLWEDQVKNAYAIQGDLGLVKSINELVLHDRGAYLLSDRLSDYPLEQDVVIFDCPATLGPLTTIAITSATHIIIPIQVEPKSTCGASRLFEWLYERFTTLRLKPQPKILGIVPLQYDLNTAIHRNLLKQLPPMLEPLGIPCFNPIRYSKEFKNASAMGLPLHLYKGKHPACQDFNEVLKTLKAELVEEQQQLWAAG